MLEHHLRLSGNRRATAALLALAAILLTGCGGTSGAATQSTVPTTHPPASTTATVATTHAGTHKARKRPRRHHHPRLRRSAEGLIYGTAATNVVQAQPPAGSCHARGSGLFVLPDPHCTPGALDLAVTQADIGRTICSDGWTATVRPPEAITEPEKQASMASYGLGGYLGGYEYDHLVPLELGGAPNSPRNLWPEPDYPNPPGTT